MRINWSYWRQSGIDFPLETKFKVLSCCVRQMLFSSLFVTSEIRFKLLYFDLQPVVKGHLSIKCIICIALSNIVEWHKMYSYLANVLFPKCEFASYSCTAQHWAILSCVGDISRPWKCYWHSLLQIRSIC